MGSGELKDSSKVFKESMIHLRRQNKYVSLIKQLTDTGNH